MKNNETTLLDLFIEHAASKSEAKRVYNAIECYFGRKIGPKDLLSMTIEELLDISGIGRKSVILITEVCCSVVGKK